MSAWLFFTVLGLYPVSPGSLEYVIGRPFVDGATLNLPNGQRFSVRITGLSDINRYVGQVTLNGKPLTRSFIRHDDIMAGGELRFSMQPSPNKGWGAEPSERPYSMSTRTN